MTHPDRSVRTVPRDSDPETDLPRAVAVRIGDRDLWLGNSGAIDLDHLEAMELRPDHVVSVNRNETAATTDHHPLVDGRVNDQSEFDAAVETALERHRQDGTVLVNCAAGISRSTTIVASVLAVEEQVSFDRAVETVQQFRRRADPHPKLRINAQSYLATVQDRDEARSALAALADEVRLGRQDDQRALAPLD